MFRNYLTITIRNLPKQKLFSFINIFSLAIGLAAVSLIYLFVRDETSFDQFHAKKESIYRLAEVQSFPGTNTQKVALSMGGMGPFMQQDFPEVKRFARYWGRQDNLYQVGDKKIKAPISAFVDSTFLAIFDYPMLYGDRENCAERAFQHCAYRKSCKQAF